MPAGTAAQFVPLRARRDTVPPPSPKIMSKPIFALLLSTFLFAACDSGNTLSSAALQFQIDVLENSTTVATGQFTFRQPTVASPTTGSFTLSTPSDDPLDPISITSGSLTASLTNEGKIEIAIVEPGVSDTGLRFEADYSGSSFSNGEWGTITFAGYTPQGTFTATRVE